MSARGSRIRGMRPELAEIFHKQIGIRGRGGNLPEAEHPCHLNAHAAAEGRAGVQVRATGLLKLRSHLGKTGEDHGHPSPGQQHGDRAELSRASRRRWRAVRTRRCQSLSSPPARSGSSGRWRERVGGAGRCLAGWVSGHRVFVSQMDVPRAAAVYGAPLDFGVLRARLADSRERYHMSRRRAAVAT